MDIKITTIDGATEILIGAKDTIEIITKTHEQCINKGFITFTNNKHKIVHIMADKVVKIEGV